MKPGSTALLEPAPDPPAAGTLEPGTAARALFREARRRRHVRWLLGTTGVVVLLVALAFIADGTFLGRGAGGTNAAPPVSAVGAGHLRIFTEQAASMEPTLRPGDRVAATTARAPLHRGDIVVFTVPSGFFRGSPFGPSIKRIVGLPGETITSVGDTVLVNGRPLAETYLPPGQPLVAPIVAQTVPAGHYFVMGDNRGDSADSRYYGPIPAASVVAVARTIVAPPSRAGPIS